MGMGHRLLAWIVCLSMCSVGWALDLESQQQFDIPAQKLSTALVEFSRQAKTPIVSSTPDVERFNSPGVTGRMSLRQALRNLLQGTGLDIKTTDSGAIAVGIFGAKPLHESESGAKTNSLPPTSANAVGTTNPSASNQDSSAASSGSETAGLSEIIVTAEKRSERIQDVPVPVTALDASQLTENSQVRFEDYYTSVPGLSFAPNEQNNFLAIRGISTGGYSNPTVGIVIDDVPFGGSTAQGGGQVMPDIDPGDLARVEVLRGPQGTLYGASSMGGLLKFVTIDPSTDAVSGRVQAGVSDVHNAGQPGYSVRASVNVPLNDTLAMSASAFTRVDPGYIDNPVYHLDGVNETKVMGGRLALLWLPSDVVTV